MAALPETEGWIGIFANVKNSSSLLIAINDNGTGIKQSLLERVFFNSKEITENDRHRSPMGLKLTKAIVEQHGGELVFESNPGKSTRVQINLPIVNAIVVAS